VSEMMGICEKQKRKEGKNMKSKQEDQAKKWGLSRAPKRANKKPGIDVSQRGKNFPGHQAKSSILTEDALRLSLKKGVAF